MRPAICTIAILLLGWHGPAPQQAATDKVQEDTEAHQEPTNNLVALIGQNATDKNKEQGAEKTGTNHEESVRITSAPKIETESKKDPYDKVLVLATCLLVIIGGFQIVYLWRTVRGMKDSMDAMIASERAWVDAVVVKKETIAIRYQLEITNHGKTPARVSSYELNYGHLPANSKFSWDKFPRASYKCIHQFVGSDKTIPVEDAIDPQKLFLGFVEGIPDSNERFICVTINYGDVVAAKPDALVTHKSFFVYKWDPLLNTLDCDPLHTRYT